jgi:hypothetical protein
MKLQLADRDNDLMDCNGEDTWTSFSDCLDDVKQSILDGNNTSEYLPFKFIDTNSKSNDVYSIINEITIEFKVTNLKVVPYKHGR